MRARDTQEGPRTGPRTGPQAGRGGDVARARERRRQRRLLRLALVLGAVLIWLAERDLSGAGLPAPSLPDIDPLYLISGGFFVALTVVLLGTSVAAGRSPHVMYRPEQIDVRMSDVQGLDAVRDDVQRSLDLFLGGATFRREMGGTPRRGLLFEGPPGTGKTHLAKAMAAEAGVPFLFVSAHRFPVHVLRRHGSKDPCLLPGAAACRPQRGGRDRVHRGDRRDRDHPRRPVRDPRTARAGTGPCPVRLRRPGGAAGAGRPGPSPPVRPRQPRRS